MRALALALIALIAAGCFDFEGLSTQRQGDLATDPCAGALVCQDFERALELGWIAEIQTGASAVAEPGAARRGNLGLRTRTPGVAGNQYATGSWVGAIAPGPLHVRFFTRSPTGLPAGFFTLILIVVAGQDTVSVGVQGDNLWAASKQGGGLEDTLSTVTFVPVAWHCVQLELDLSTGAGAFRIDQGARSAWGPIGPVAPTQLNFGVARGSDAEPTEVHVDDIVVSRSPIPCD